LTRDFYDKVDPVAVAPSAASVAILPAQNKLSSAEELQSRSVFEYNEASPSLFPVRYESLVTGLVSSLKEGSSFTSDPNEACAFVAMLRALLKPLMSRPGCTHWSTGGEMA